MSYKIDSLLKLRYSLDETTDTFFQWEGSVFAFIPGQAPTKIFNCIGMNVSKAKIEENKLKAWGKELAYYLDPKTGEKLSFWDNPWTGEKSLPVVHIANDPVQMAIPTFIPLDIRHNKFNKTSSIVSEIPLSYPNPLTSPDKKFDDYDPNSMYEAGEFFSFKCSSQDLDKPETIDQVDVNWTRLSKFAPFMKMGKHQGYLLYHCTGYKLPQGSTANDLHPILAEEIKNDMQSYATILGNFDPSVKNVSSWTYFKDNFDRYINQPEATWPVPAPLE